MTFIQDQESFCDMLHSQQEEIPYDPSYEELDEFRQWNEISRLLEFVDFLVVLQSLQSLAFLQKKISETGKRS